MALLAPRVAVMKPGPPPWRARSTVLRRRPQRRSQANCTWVPCLFMVSRLDGAGPPAPFGTNRIQDVNVARLSEPAPEEETARDSLEGRVDRPEAMYRSLVESLPGITYAESLDDARTLSISPQIVEMLGYTEGEWMADSLPVDAARAPGGPGEGNRVLRPGERGGRTIIWQAEYRMIARDGRVCRSSSSA